MKAKYIGIIIAVSFLMFLLTNNLTVAYYPMSCTWNQYECGSNYEGFDGNCTSAMAQDVQDVCCMEVRMCSGQLVDNPDDCIDKYCTNAGNHCYPVYQTATANYKCTCKSVTDPLL